MHCKDNENVFLVRKVYGNSLTLGGKAWRTTSLFPSEPFKTNED